MLFFFAAQLPNTVPNTSHHNPQGGLPEQSVSLDLLPAAWASRQVGDYCSIDIVELGAEILQEHVASADCSSDLHILDVRYTHT